LSVSEPEPEVLKKVTRDTFTNVLKPRMLSGHFQGRLLAMISQILRPKNILEIGTYVGYSAICLSEGLQENGRLVTIEANEEFENRILNNFEAANINHKIELHIGKALEIIPKLDMKFDLVFIDADKMNYINYYDAVFPKINLGGLILSDNVLWNNKVVDETKNDPTTLLLREFNQKLKKDTRTQKILLPIRDGLFVTRKIKES
jgi:caffeoyl-CoA O-methyltransferase